MYQEMRSSKTMKRKWHDSETAKKMKPKPASEQNDEQESESESEEEEDYGRDYYDQEEAKNQQD